MSSPHPSLTRRMVAALVTIAASLCLVQGAQAADRPSLLPPAGNVPFLVGHGTGVQIYQCTATIDGYRWIFVAPRATLTDFRGRTIMSHFGGPTWQANDGSKVVGALAESRTVNPNAIPWLLLGADSYPAPGGGGLLADTSYVQRLFTTGGLAPTTSPCGSDNAGVKAEIPYTAEYVFWKPIHHR
jgi:hypothetical protein